MNSFNFTGNIPRDAVMRFMPNGDAITSFSVALSSGYGDKKITSWMNCTMFGKRGESVAPYLLKGVQVGISGEFAARPYKDKEGNEKISLDVRVSDLTLLGGKPKSDNDSSQTDPRQSAPVRQQSAQLDPCHAFAGMNDDIPF